MEKQLYATLKIDMENISARLAKVIEAAEQLESAVNELQSTLSSGVVEVTLRESESLSADKSRVLDAQNLDESIRKIVNEEFDRRRLKTLKAAYPPELWRALQSKFPDILSDSHE